MNDKERDKNHDRQIDEILRRAAQLPDQPDPAVLDRLIVSIAETMAPVRPLPSTALLTTALFTIAAAIALAGAFISGPHGFQNMSPWQRFGMFPSLALLLLLTSAAVVAELIPGSRRLLSPKTLLCAATALLLALFAFLFRDHRISNFLHQGIVCLAVGIGYAIPAALASWLLLRRGFAVDPSAAGLVAGTLAGLAGVTMLELHCPNFEAFHLLLWHTAVVVLSALTGSAIARR